MMSAGPNGPVSRARYDRERRSRLESERIMETQSRELWLARQARTQFLNLISHELKTPLHGIMGAAQSLAMRSPADDEVEAVLNCARSLDTLIDTLLSLSELDSRTMTLSPSKVRVPQLLADVRAAFLPVAAAKGVDLEVDCGELSHIPVHADAKRLTQILVALVSNAVKFTPSGKIRLAAKWVGEEMHFAVHDSGVGIPAHKREKIFERFSQGEDFTRRRFGGAGLGLSLVKELIHLMGGQLTVCDSPLGGACFRMAVRLPKADAPCADELAASDRALRVLIVDDDPLNRRIARAAVERAGMVTHEAENGAEGLNALAQDSVDVVLMDIQMPVMTGDEAIKRIRGSSAPWHGVPIIVLTAHGRREGGNPYGGIGANLTLDKPVDFGVLVSAVRQMAAIPQQAA